MVLVPLTLLFMAPPPAICVARTDCEAQCAQGDGVACRRLGQALIEGWLGAADAQGGDKALARGCELKDPWSCLHLSERAPEDAVAWPRALSVANAACEAGDPDGCVVAVNGAEPGEARWALYVKACELGASMACGLARLERQGRPLPDTATGEDAQARAVARCEAGDDAACEGAGHSAYVGGQLGAVTAPLEQRCRQGWPRACRSLGRVYADLRDRDAALAAFRRGCQGHDRASCDGEVLAHLIGEFRVTRRVSGGPGCKLAPDPGPAVLLVTPELGEKLSLMLCGEGRRDCQMQPELLGATGRVPGNQREYWYRDAQGVCIGQRFSRTLTRTRKGVRYEAKTLQGPLPKGACSGPPELSGVKLPCHKLEQLDAIPTPAAH